MDLREFADKTVESERRLLAALNMKYGEGGKFGSYVAGYMSAMAEARKLAAEAGNNRPSA